MPGWLVLVLLSGSCTASHYETLSVPHDAKPTVIKAAYRKAALRSHPDKIPRGHSTAGRATAAQRMERLNEAYATLIDPVKRREYDLSLLRNPWHRSSSSSTQQAPARVVRMSIDCTLTQLGGYEAVEVPLHEAFSLPAGGAPPPMRIFLPPGSASGALHRISLPHLNTVLVLKLMYTAPHALYSREGDDLSMTIHFAAWHNRAWWRWCMRRLSRSVTVRALGDEESRHAVCASNVVVPPAGKHYKLRGLGMPRASAMGVATSPYGCERGDLHVFIRLRSLEQSCRRYASAAAAALGCGAVLHVALRWPHGLVWRLLPKRRRRVRVISRWTGPGPGISAPFRRWDEPGLWKYKDEYV